MKHLKILSILAVGAVAMVSLQALAAGTWTPPTEAPPGGNVDAPVNVGDQDQSKTGILGLVDLVVTRLTTTDSELPAAGKILTVLDTNGTVGWRTPAEGLESGTVSMAANTSKKTITFTKTYTSVPNVIVTVAKTYNSGAGSYEPPYTLATMLEEVTTTSAVVDVDEWVSAGDWQGNVTREVKLHYIVVPN